MSYIQGGNRKQMTLFTECIDDLVSEDNAMRAIDAFVMSLNGHYLKNYCIKKSLVPVDGTSKCLSAYTNAGWSCSLIQKYN